MLGQISRFRSRILHWYHQNRRDLPWRIPRQHAKTPNATPNSTPDPYLVLVSEAMLQQTQVATVVPYFHRFIKTFPTLTDLADATEQDVLRLWQGLGYYSRARNLHATAKILRNQNPQPRIPQTVDELLQLPGIGRYTAGAIASIAFNQRAPILDGNVIRVLSRLDLKRNSPDKESPDKESLWRRAEELLPRNHPGDFNSALMELGATICTPRNPKCLLCPVRSHCAAHAAGVQEQIPPPSPRKNRPLERRLILAISHHDHYLLEQRPPTGRWASMWQFITIKASKKIPTLASLSKIIGLKLTHIRPLGSIHHNLTHRRYHFQIFACRANGAGRVGRTRGSPLQPTRCWVGLDGLSDFPLSRPQLEVAKLVSSLTRIGPVHEFRRILPSEAKLCFDLADPSLDEV